MSSNANDDNVQIMKLLKVLLNDLKQEQNPDEVNINKSIKLMLQYLQLMNVLEGNDVQTSAVNEANIEKYMKKLQENTQELK